MDGLRGRWDTRPSFLVHTALLLLFPDEAVLADIAARRPMPDIYADYAMSDEFPADFLAAEQEKEALLESARAAAREAKQVAGAGDEATAVQEASQEAAAWEEAAAVQEASPEAAAWKVATTAQHAAPNNTVPNNNCTLFPNSATASLVPSLHNGSVSGSVSVEPTPWDGAGLTAFGLAAQPSGTP